MENQKPKAVCLDVDDVIADFIGFLILIHNKRHKTYLTRNEISGYPMKGDEIEDIYGDIVPNENIIKTFKDLEPHGLYAILPIFPEARQAMILMKELGYKIILMTARPTKFKEQTILNLQRNDVPYDELFFEKDKAEKINKLKDKYDIVLFADDRASTVKSVNNNCNVQYPVLVNRPHNEKSSLSKNITRVDDLLETIKLLKEDKNEQSDPEV